MSPPNCLTLVLLRHGAAEPPVADDFSRSLTSAGRQELALTLKRAAASGPQVSGILVSPALRAWESAAIAAQALGVRATPAPIDGLYGGTVSSYLRATRAHAQGQTCLLVAHNPTLEELVQALTGEWVPMGTAALVVLTVRASSWGELWGADVQVGAVFSPLCGP